MCAFAKVNKAKAAKVNKAKAVKVNKAKADKVDTELKVGMRVHAKWQGEGPQQGYWFEGVILSINEVEMSAHVKFDDGDEDDELYWFNISIIDEKDG